MAEPSASNRVRADSPGGEEIAGELAVVPGLSASTVVTPDAAAQVGLVVSDRRGMSVFHRVRPEALQALYVGWL